MSEFDDVSMEAPEAAELDIPDSCDWTDFDAEVIEDLNDKTAETPDVSEVSLDLGSEEEAMLSEAEKAADYARSFGFEKAADYIARHYDGDKFIPGDPIPITTRNMALEGMQSDNGVSFERRKIGRAHV